MSIKKWFKKLFGKKDKIYIIIPIFIPHRGCPEDCVFCNQVKIAGAMPNLSASDARKIIDKHLETIKKEKDTFIEIAFFGGSFTAVDEEFQNMMLELANEYIKAGKVDGIRISTRPDKINKEIIKRLKKYNVSTIELGIQSSNDYILKQSRRGHNFESVIKASKLIRKNKINFGAQMMVGLPESNYIDEINSAKDIVKLKPNMVRIYPCLVIKNTDLEKMYIDEKYKPLTLDEAVEIVKQVSKIFIEKEIPIIRIGLQETDEITNPENESSSIVAGPYHPNFRELVDSKLWYEKIVDQISKINAKIKEAKIYIHPKNASKVLGYKKENIKKLKENYSIDVVLEYNMTMKLDEFVIKPTEVYEFDDLNIIGEQWNIKKNKKKNKKQKAKMKAKRK